MDAAAFWNLIEATRRDSADCEDLAESLLTRLTSMSETEIVGFGRAMDQLLDRAYRWDLWAAAYIINGGCSDDGFEYFRCWLIAQGRDVYEKALADPESLAGVAEPDVECEDLLYVPLQAFEAKTGSEEPPPRYAPHPEAPTGDEWDEDTVEGLFPRLAEAFK